MLPDRQTGSRSDVVEQVVDEFVGGAGQLDAGQAGVTLQQVRVLHRDGRQVRVGDQHERSRPLAPVATLDLRLGEQVADLGRRVLQGARALDRDR